MEITQDSSSARRILLLGGHGFVGTNLVEAFAGSRHEIAARSRRDGLDLRDLDGTWRAVEQHAPQVIVNCAANVGSLNYVTELAAEVIDDNLRMLLNLYRAVSEIPADRRPTIVNPVANCAYPGHLELYREEDFWNGPVHPSVLSYGSSRRMMLVIAECYASERGVRTVSLLTPNMYGAHDSTDPNKAHAVNALIAKLVAAEAAGEPTFEVWGSGEPVREWLYAGDFGRVVRQVVERLDGERFEQPFNVAQKKGFSIRQVVDLLVGELGYRGRVTWDRSRPDGAPRKVMDDARFRRLFPEFRFTELADGVRRTAAYYRSLR